MSKNPYNLPDKAYQFWKPFFYKYQEYSLEHLTATKRTFFNEKKQEKYTLYFTFSHHVFTSSKKEIALDDELLYNFPKEDLRVFNFERYKLSKNIPNIIENLQEQYFYHGGYSRYCSSKVYLESGEEVYYQIVYRVWKERGKMRFHIESAYPLDKRGKTKKVNFWVICHNLATGKNYHTPLNRENLTLFEQLLSNPLKTLRSYTVKQPRFYP